MALIATSIDRPTLAYRKSPLEQSRYDPQIDSIQEFGKQPEQGADVAVVVVAYQTGEKLYRCLDSVIGQTVRPSRIIVLDNSPQETDGQRIAGYPITYVAFKDNVGPSSARNLGACLAHTDLVAFVDDDGYLDSEYVEKAVEIFGADTSISAARGRVIQSESDDAEPVPHYDLGDTQFPAIPQTEGNLVIKRAQFVECGGFEDGLYGSEGVVLGYRMTRFYNRSREAFIYHPSLILYHQFHKSADHLVAKFLRYEWLRYWIRLSYPDMTQYRKYYYAQQREKGRQRRVEPTEIETRAKEAAVEQFRNELNENHETTLAARWGTQLERQSGEDFRPDFAVVITCFNLGKYLERAVKSVLRQTLEKLEVVIVDDVSTEPATLEVLERLETVVRVVRQPENRGVAAARNAGIAATSAPLICCLDADDYLEPTYLEKALAHFRMDEQVGIVSSYLKLVGGESGTFRYKPFELKDLITDAPVHTASCFRRDACAEGDHYDEALRGYEDWDHWIRIGRRGWDTVIIPEELFFYYRTPTSKVHTSHKNADKLLARIIENHREAYEQNLTHVIATKHKKLSDRNIALRLKNKECDDLNKRIASLEKQLEKAIKAAKRPPARETVPLTPKTELRTDVRRSKPSIQRRFLSLLTSVPLLLVTAINAAACFHFATQVPPNVLGLFLAVGIEALALMLVWHYRVSADRLEDLAFRTAVNRHLIVDSDARRVETASALQLSLERSGEVDAALEAGLIEANSMLSRQQSEMSRLRKDTVRDVRAAVAGVDDAITSIGSGLQELSDGLFDEFESIRSGVREATVETTAGVVSLLEQQSRRLGEHLSAALTGMEQELTDRAKALSGHSERLARHHDEFSRAQDELGRLQEKLEESAQRTGRLLSRLHGDGTGAERSELLGGIENLERNLKAADGKLREELAAALGQLRQNRRLLEAGKDAKQAERPASAQELIQEVNAQDNGRSGQVAIALDRLHLEMRRQLATLRKHLDALN